MMYARCKCTLSSQDFSYLQNTWHLEVLHTVTNTLQLLTGVWSHMICPSVKKSLCIWCANWVKCCFYFPIMGLECVQEEPNARQKKQNKKNRTKLKKNQVSFTQWHMPYHFYTHSHRCIDESQSGFTQGHFMIKGLGSDPSAFQMVEDLLYPLNPSCL